MNLFSKLGKEIKFFEEELNRVKLSGVEARALAIAHSFDSAQDDPENENNNLCPVFWQNSSTPSPFSPTFLQNLCKHHIQGIIEAIPIS